MKILQGNYKGVELLTTEGELTRPTVDHMKKNILKLTTTLKVKVVWDLFAGVGGVGLEFLSLGASEVVFVEESNKGVTCIQGNLGYCQMKNPDFFKNQKSFVCKSRVENFLSNPEKFGIKNMPDLIFMDPPYGMGLISKTLSSLNTCSFLKQEVQILIEGVEEEVSGLVQSNIIAKHTYGPKTLLHLSLGPSGNGP